MQRRLVQLVEDGSIRCEGSGKGRVYFPGRSAVAEAPASFRAAPGDTVVLSTAGLEAQKLINAPQSKTPRVGYNEGFLAKYKPNTTFYLPEHTRGELAQIGRLDAGELPAGTYLRQVLDRLVIDLSWNSSRLEGNTYSLLETERLLAGGEGADGKNTGETQMILNHKAAIELLADQTDEVGFNRYTICNLHALLSDNLLRNTRACGRLRDRPVGITGTSFRPLAVPRQIEKNFEIVLEKAGAIEDPFEAAFFAMVHLPYLQAFEDVNKRVSRLAANIPLVRGNFCPLSFVDVGRTDYLGGLIAVYEFNRTEYLRDVFVRAYTRSCQRYTTVRQSLGAPDPFRLEYRREMSELTREIVRSGMDKAAAARAVKSRAEAAIPAGDQARFIEAVETELGSLHIGNIARHQLRPHEFDAWESTWR